MRIAGGTLALLCTLALLLSACSSAAPNPSPGAPAPAAPASSPAVIATAVPALPPPAPSPAASPAAAPAQSAAATNAPPPKPGGEIVMGMDTEAQQLDPHVSGSRHEYIVMNSIFDSLIAQDDDLSFKPWLAERWEVSPDNLSYTFYLKRGVKFHDG